MIQKHTTCFRTMNSAQILQISHKQYMMRSNVQTNNQRKQPPLDPGKTEAVLFVIFVSLKP
jgi:hypothetical protein